MFINGYRGLLSSIDFCCAMYLSIQSCFSICVHESLYNSNEVYDWLKTNFCDSGPLQKRYRTRYSSGQPERQYHQLVAWQWGWNLSNPNQAFQWQWSTFCDIR